MSERERWIIYPLLFLAISAALKDKIVTPMSIRVNQLEAKQITTGQITSSRAKFDQTSSTDVFATTVVAKRISIIDKKNQPKVILDAENQDKQDFGDAGVQQNSPSPTDR